MTKYRCTPGCQTCTKTSVPTTRKELAPPQCCVHKFIIQGAAGTRRKAILRFARKDIRQQCSASSAHREDNADLVARWCSRTSNHAAASSHLPVNLFIERFACYPGLLRDPHEHNLRGYLAWEDACEHAGFAVFDACEQAGFAFFAFEMNNRELQHATC